MSGVNKEAPVAATPLAKTPEQTPSEAGVSTTTTATPTKVDATTPIDTVKQPVFGSANTAAEKTAKIFGSFGSSETTTSKEETSTTQQPLFGGFKFGTSSASAWSAPTTAGGFGAASSFALKKEEEGEDKEDVLPPLPLKHLSLMGLESVIDVLGGR